MDRFYSAYRTWLFPAIAKFADPRIPSRLPIYWLEMAYPGLN